ncbi:hypothetical protein, partial [Profundibacterium mesophilum]
MEVGLAIAIGAPQPVAELLAQAAPAYAITASGGTVTRIEEQSDHLSFRLTGHPVAQYDGDYLVAKAALAEGWPVFLRAPVSRGTGPDHVVDAGLVIAPSDDPPEITRQWFVGTDTVARASGSTYTLPPEDDGLELRYVEIAANVAGTEERSIVAQQEVVAAVQPAVTLAAGTFLKKVWPFSTSTNLLYHANISLPTLPTSNASFIDLFNGDMRVIYKTDGSVSVQRLAREGGNIHNISVVPPGALSAGDRVGILLEIDTGTANAARAAYKRNDAPWVMSFDGAIP